MTDRIKFMGMPGSPYTRKMLAVLRYRRIAYEYMVGMPAYDAPPELPQPKVALLPTFWLPNADGELEALIDSTPLIRRLEQDYSERSVIPSDPVVAFINELIEDYADEWLTKAMFHYRWAYADDIERAGTILPLWLKPDMNDAMLAEQGKAFSDRQINRLRVVGSNETTAPVIEASFKRFLDIMDKLLQSQPYVMGHRPGSADFAIYGQLTALTHFDPTPMAETLQRAPRVYAWVDLMEDLSGAQTGDWWQTGSVPDGIMELLNEIGRTYLPAMKANAATLIAGNEVVETQVDGRPWQQQVFPYQGKCLQWLTDSYKALDVSERKQVDQLLTETSFGLVP